ncbi:MAG: ribonuclease HII [Candidatus Wildermuthbacteria bacterium]|nr:ribonuclease HII [Candidatus Wildermuthbacteria bacterium]
MVYATLAEEKKLWKKGYQYVAGLDEAGRGPLAGPVVAGAVVIKNCKFKIKNLKLRDSKQLSAKQREYFYEILTSHKEVRWGIGIVSEKVIDKINILQATKLAMEKAVINLDKKIKKQRIQKTSDRGNFVSIEFLILDGNFKINFSIPQKSIVKGDEKVFSCAAASILAKVTRDRLMMRYHKKYPRYHFDLHKGYGTRLHLKRLKRFGRCAIHRNSFNVQ